MTTLEAIPPGGLLSRSAEKIAQVLKSLQDSARAITTVVGDQSMLFASRLSFVDPERGYIGVACSSQALANTALLARPSASFVAEVGNWHIEFVAMAPRLGMLGGVQTILFDFPKLVVSQDKRRAVPRASAPKVVLHCLADESGFAPFEAKIIDISSRGIGFLFYESGISLEPGTVLKGCRIERSNKPPVIVDLEVRYSTSVEQPGGGYAHRSGCVFLNPTRQVIELIESFNANPQDDE